MKYFIYFVIGLVGVAVIGGFFIVGSPQEGRLRRFDDRRIQDLSTIQNVIVDYWQSKQELPPNLESLEDDLRGISIPIDPDTASSYGYSIKSPRTFELCANFSLSILDQSEAVVPKGVYPYSERPYGITSSNWAHDAGYVCFERTIDPDFFKPPQPTN